MNQAEEMRLVTQRGVGDAPLPKKYEAARAALAACQKVDECSTWAKKAAALASYARQAGDKSLEDMAMRIRARAVKRTGELLREIEPKPGKRTDKEPRGGASPRLEAARNAGLSPDQVKQSLRVAAVPSAAFESAVEAPRPATIPQLAEMGTRKKPAPLVDLQGRDPGDFNASLHVQADIARLAATVHGTSVATVVRGCMPDDINDLLHAATDLHVWLGNLLKEIT